MSTILTFAPANAIHSILEQLGGWKTISKEMANLYQAIIEVQKQEDNADTTYVRLANKLTEAFHEEELNTFYVSDVQDDDDAEIKYEALNTLFKANVTSDETIVDAFHETSIATLTAATFWNERVLDTYCNLSEKMMPQNELDKTKLLFMIYNDGITNLMNEMQMMIEKHNPNTISMCEVLIEYVLSQHKGTYLNPLLHIFEQTLSAIMDDFRNVAVTMS